MVQSLAGGNAFIVALDGILDVYRAPEVRRKLRQGLQQHRLVIDLSDVHVLGAAILTEFVRCNKERVSKGLEPARLVVGTNGVRKVLEITGLATVWPIFSNLAAACMP